MAKLWIQEFRATASRPSGQPLVSLDQQISEQVVNFTTHAESTPMAAGTYLVRLYADNDCHVKAGFSPEATVESLPMTAGQPEYFAVSPGSIISVVEAA